MMYKEQLIDTIYESNYEKAHREALARPVPFDTCRQCSRYNGGCTIGFKLKRVGIHFVCKDFFDKEEAEQIRIEQKSW